MDRLERIKTSGREDWLEVRRQGVGGSDAAAIIGCNDYSSPYTVWLDKTGRLPEKEPTEAMRQGTDLEDYVAKRFAEKTGKKVRRKNDTLRNPKYPFALANVDRWVVGENAGLECKTANTLNYAKFRDGEFPANYYVQCMHYMAVTGADRWYLAVLVFGREFIVFELERDEELIDWLMEAERRFWDSVVSGEAPKMDGGAATDKALAGQYPGGGEGDVDLFGIDFARLGELKREKKGIESQIRKIEQEAKARLGDAESGHADGFRVTWRPQTRRSFDPKAFAADNPDVDLSPYWKETSSRVFRVKEA